MSKFYAVRKGRKTGVFSTWADCQKQVTGYSGAEFKGFKSKNDAIAYLDGIVTSSSTFQKPLLTNAQETSYESVAYVDGSFFKENPYEFSYGVVIFWKQQQFELSEKITDPDLASMRNVAGEIKGAEAAMQFALDHQISEIAIYHDYAGIAAWCTGAWLAKKTGTQAYKRFYDEATKKITVHFIKVKGHSGDMYNDLADKLAKRALNSLS